MNPLGTSLRAILSRPSASLDFLTNSPAPIASTFTPDKQLRQRAVKHHWERAERLRSRGLLKNQPNTAPKRIK